MTTSAAEKAGNVKKVHRAKNGWTYRNILHGFFKWIVTLQNILIYHLFLKQYFLLKKMQ